MRDGSNLLAVRRPRDRSECKKVPLRILSFGDAMHTAPCTPSDRLARTGSDSQLVGRGSVVRLDLTAQLHADGRDVSKARALALPDAEGMAVDADVWLANNAAREFAEFGP